jgi:hypothetical protein
VIRVIRGVEVKPGIWAYSVAQYGVQRRSRQPLLDACRQLKRMGVALDARVGLFREGRQQADITCSVEVGAGLTVDEAGPRFAKWRPRDPSTWKNS